MELYEEKWGGKQAAEPPDHSRYGLTEDLNLSALRRQLEDVEYCICCFVLVCVLFSQVTMFNPHGCNDSSVGMSCNIPDEILENPRDIYVLVRSQQLHNYRHCIFTDQVYVSLYLVLSFTLFVKLVM
ncbi:hypothetical protein Hanom_Chr04g00309871 [Helianthus anomalus]